MRISDWSSDVCSSDLEQRGGDDAPGDEGAVGQRAADHHRAARDRQRAEPVVDARGRVLRHARRRAHPGPEDHGDEEARHEEVDVAEAAARVDGPAFRSEEHTSELQSLMRISYAVFCLKQKNTNTMNT